MDVSLRGVQREETLDVYLLLFTCLITLGKDVTIRHIKEFKTNRCLSYLSVNRIPD